MTPRVMMRRTSQKSTTNGSAQKRAQSGTTMTVLVLSVVKAPQLT